MHGMHRIPLSFLKNFFVPTLLFCLPLFGQFLLHVYCQHFLAEDDHILYLQQSNILSDLLLNADKLEAHFFGMGKKTHLKYFSCCNLEHHLKTLVGLC